MFASQFPHFASQSHCPSNKKCVASQVTSKNHKRSIWISLPGTSARREKQLTSNSCWRTYINGWGENSFKKKLQSYTSWILAMANLYSLLRLTCRWLRSFCWLSGCGCTWTTRCLVKSQIDTTKAHVCYKWMHMYIYIYYIRLVAVCILAYLNISYIYIHMYIYVYMYKCIYNYVHFMC